MRMSWQKLLKHYILVFTSGKRYAITFVYSFRQKNKRQSRYYALRYELIWIDGILSLLFHYAYRNLSPFLCEIDPFLITTKPLRFFINYPAPKVVRLGILEKKIQGNTSTIRTLFDDRSAHCSHCMSSTRFK